MITVVHRPLSEPMILIYIYICIYQFNKMHLKLLTVKKNPLCLGLNVININAWKSPNQYTEFIIGKCQLDWLWWTLGRLSWWRQVVTIKNWVSFCESYVHARCNHDNDNDIAADAMTMRKRSFLGLGWGMGDTIVKISTARVKCRRIIYLNTFSMNIRSLPKHGG